MLGQFEFVLLHEVGHAFVHVMNIPMVGKEEDAVDTLATIIAIVRNERTTSGPY